MVFILSFFSFSSFFVVFFCFLFCLGTSWRPLVFVGVILQLILMFLVMFGCIWPENVKIFSPFFSSLFFSFFLSFLPSFFLSCCSPGSGVNVWRDVRVCSCCHLLNAPKTPPSGERGLGENLFSPFLSLFLSFPSFLPSSFFSFLANIFSFMSFLSFFFVYHSLTLFPCRAFCGFPSADKKDVPLWFVFFIYLFSLQT